MNNSSFDSYQLPSWTCLVLFALTGLFTAIIIPVCYTPEYISESVSWMAAFKESPLLRAAVADRSGMSMACVALTFFVLARFWKLRERLDCQFQVATRALSELKSNPRSNLDGLIDKLSRGDAVRNFLEGIRQRTRGESRDPDTGLELLHRRMMRDIQGVGNWIIYMVTLGLLGTLLGVWIGFVLTFGIAESGTHSLQLNVALRQCVVVVATACISSVCGIGLGQLFVHPLFEFLKQRMNLVIDKAMALEDLK